jgi:hypothetical protein
MTSPKVNKNSSQRRDLFILFGIQQSPKFVKLKIQLYETLFHVFVSIEEDI